MAFSSIAAQKMRAILTTLGIIIGVAAVIIVVAIGQGAEQKLKEQMIGVENIRTVYFEPSEEDQAQNPNIWFGQQYTEQDLEDIQALPDVQSVVATASDYRTLSVGEMESEADIIGTNMHYFDLYQYEAMDGELLTPIDFLAGTRKVVISSSLAEMLFPYESPVGQTMKIGAYPMEIIGVLAPSESILSYEYEQVIMPYETWKQIFFREGYSGLSISAASVEQAEWAVADVMYTLNTNHDTIDAYQSHDVSQYLEADAGITQILTVIIGGIAGISLLVGGIGVMNIMLVSVTERTREIGIRKSMGATTGQIMLQFLVESVVLTFLGGLMGILIGSLLVVLIGNGFDLDVALSIPVITIATTFSIVVGVIFGLLPANKAAKLDPVDALRYE
ncbi:ABC transporter, ATP-binding protein [Bacillus sp. JCM 19047]|nr:ABC transporter, ATP-binding protein [Bacillus sp. JCM 19047]